MLLLDKRGPREPYAPANLAAIKAAFCDPATPPAWVGREAWVAAVCFNTVEAQKLGLPRPASWFDLLDPRLPPSGAYPAGRIAVAASTALSSGRRGAHEEAIIALI